MTAEPNPNKSLELNVDGLFPFHPDRLELIEIVRKINESAGITEADIAATSEKLIQEARTSQIANGVRPHMNEASRELMRIRYGEEYDTEQINRAADPDDEGDDDMQEHRRQMRNLVYSLNAQAGYYSGPKITAEEVQAMIQAQGVNPDDNICSREILQMRYGRDYEQE